MFHIFCKKFTPFKVLASWNSASADLRLKIPPLDPLIPLDARLRCSPHHLRSLQGPHKRSVDLRSFRLPSGAPGIDWWSANFHPVHWIALQANCLFTSEHSLVISTPDYLYSSDFWESENVRKCVISLGLSSLKCVKINPLAFPLPKTEYTQTHSFTGSQKRVFCFLEDFSDFIYSFIL